MLSRVWWLYDSGFYVLRGAVYICEAVWLRRFILADGGQDTFTPLLIR